MEQSDQEQSFKFQNSSFRKNLFGFVGYLINLFADLEIHHAERAASTGGAMYAANHVNSFDWAVLQVCVPRTLCFMSKAELFRNPLMKYILNKVGSFPVNRSGFDLQAIRNAQEVLKSGLALMMFPEGTRTYGKGMVQAKTGTAHLAMKSGCTIIPVAIYGLEEMFKHRFKKAQVNVVFCQPIMPGKNENAGDLTTRIMKGIAAELPAKMRGVYA